MATIFRGPTYAQQQRKPPLGSGWVNPDRFLTALVLLSTVPFTSPTQEVVGQQHPSHAKSANPDTSRGMPKTLYADSVSPAFNAPHKAPDRKWPVTDTSAGEPLTLRSPVAVQAPFFNPHTPIAQIRRTLADTSRGSFNLADDSVATAQIEFLPAPHLKRIGSETSQGSPRILLQVVAAAPFSNPLWPNQRLMWLPADASHGVPKPLYEDASRPFRTRPLKTVDRRWPVQDTTTYGVVPTYLLPGVSGAVAYTNANDTLAASGTSEVTGTLAYTNANDVLAGVGTSTVTGILAQSNANDTLSAAGTSTVTGSLATTNANDTIVAAGGTINGTVDVTNANDTLQAFGTAGDQQTGGGGGKKRKKTLIPPRDDRRDRVEERIAATVNGVPLEDGSVLPVTLADEAPVQRQDDDDDLAFILSL